MLSTWFSNKPVQAENAKSKREQDRVYHNCMIRTNTNLSLKSHGKPVAHGSSMMSRRVKFCDVCRKNTHKQVDHYAQFVTGSSSMQRNSVTHHENSEKHRREMSTFDRSAQPEYRISLCT